MYLCSVNELYIFASFVQFRLLQTDYLCRKKKNMDKKTVIEKAE